MAIKITDTLISVLSNSSQNNKRKSQENWYEMCRLLHAATDFESEFCQKMLYKCEDYKQ